MPDYIDIDLKIYIHLLAVITSFIVICLNKNDIFSYKITVLVCTPLLFFISIVLGLRDIYSTPDTWPYYTLFEDIKSGNEINLGYEKAFVILNEISIFLRLDDVRYLFVFIAFILMMSAVELTYSISKSILVIAVVILAYSNYPFYYSLSGNVIRQGLAIALFTFIISRGMSNNNDIDKVKITIYEALMIIPILFHNSLLIAVFAFYLAKLIHERKTILTGWIVVSLSSFLNFGNSGLIEPLVDFLGLNKMNSYLINTSSNYNVGFRVDFWIFSSIPLFLLLFFSRKSMLNAKVFFLLKFTSLLSIAHIFLLFIPYNDRFGVMSWFYYPILVSSIIFTLLSRNKNHEN